MILTRGWPRSLGEAVGVQGSADLSVLDGVGILEDARNLPLKLEEGVLHLMDEDRSSDWNNLRRLNSEITANNVEWSVRTTCL